MQLEPKTGKGQEDAEKSGHCIVPGLRRRKGISVSGDWPEVAVLSTLRRRITALVSRFSTFNRELFSEFNHSFETPFFLFKKF